MHDSSHTANQLYTGDAATYGNTHAPATYRQAGCQDVSYSIDCQFYIDRFSWDIVYRVFNLQSILVRDRHASQRA